MVTKKDLVIAVLSTFCLTLALFMALPVKSSPDIGAYDPWVDMNDDGTINFLDAILLGGAFGTSGDPTKNVNVTNFPLDAQGNLKVKVAQNQMQTYNESVKISLVDFKSDPWLALQVANAYTYPFIFNPKAQSFNVTDCSIAYELSAGIRRILGYKMNGVPDYPSEPLPDTTDETYYTKQIGRDPRFLNALQSGVNYFTIEVEGHSQPIQINYLALFIEYEYLA